MAQKPFRKANSANDGAEWWIADSVASLPLTYNPAIKAGDMAVIKPTDPISGNRYDIYMYKTGPNRWEKIIDGEGTVSADEKVKVSANDTTTGYLLSKIVAGANITISENNDGGNETITITTTGEANTSSNVGTGEGIIAKTKDGVVLPFKTLKAGNNVSIVDGINEVTINSQYPAVNHPVRIEECDGKIYIVCNVAGTDYGVEATSFNCVGNPCPTPTPLVVDGLVVTLGPGGTATLNATDLDLGSFDSNGNTPLAFSVSRDDVTYSSSIEINCDDAAAGFVPVYFRVTNSCGSYDNHNVFVGVQDPNGYCEP